MRQLVGNIAVFGDWERNWSWMRRALHHAAERGADAVLQLGDMGFFAPGELDFLDDELDRLGLDDLLWLDGNHDNHDLLASLPLDADGLHPTSRRTRHVPRGRVVLLNQMRAMAFGGAFSLDRRHRTEGVDWWASELVDEAQVEAVRDVRADVLLTHECPGSTPSRTVDGWVSAHPSAESRAQRELLARVWASSGARVNLHGHHHRAYLDEVDGCVVAGLGREGQPWDQQMALLWPHGWLDIIGRSASLPATS